MDNSIKSNHAVIESLDNLHCYATQYKERLGDKSDEQKKKEEDFVKTYLQKNKSLSIQEQIAETLKLAKIKEDEKKMLELQKKKDKEINEKIVKSQLEYYLLENEILDGIEESVAQFIADQMKMELEALETQIIIEREEKKRKEKDELLKQLRKQGEERQRKLAEEKANAEREMKEKIMRELQTLKSLEKKNSSKMKDEEKQKEVERLQREKEEKELEKQKIEENRKKAELEKRNLVKDEAKKMTFLSAMKDFLKEKGSSKKTKDDHQDSLDKATGCQPTEEPTTEAEDEQCEKLRTMIEHDRKIALELQKKRKEEEEFHLQATKEEDARRAQLYAEVRKLENEKKRKQLEKHENEEHTHFENKPLIERTMLLPLLAKFEQLSKLATEEEHATKVLRRERRRQKAKTKSKQFLNKVIAAIPRSKKNLNDENQIKREPNDTKDGMKNYLITHVLFDGGENVRSVDKEPIKSQEFPQMTCYDKVCFNFIYNKV